MKQLLIILAIFISNITTAQVWHSAKDTLKLPKSPGNIYNSMGYLNKYDTVRIKYTTDSIYCGTFNSIREGYKVVFINHGFYCDDTTTYGVLLDDKKQRIHIVDKYSFITN